MARRLVSIEITPSAIRGLCIAKQMGRHSLVDTFTLAATQGESVADTVARIAATLEETHPSPDAVTICLDPGQALLQPLVFPFSDLNTIRDVARFELESLTPVSLEEYAWDVVPLPGAASQQQQVLAILYPLETVLAWRDQCQAYGLPLQRLTLQDLDLAFLQPRQNALPSLLLSTDAHQSVILRFQNNRILDYRPLPWGPAQCREDLEAIHALASETGDGCDGAPPIPLDVWQQSPSFVRWAQELTLSLAATPTATDGTLCCLTKNAIPPGACDALGEQIGLPCAPFTPPLPERGLAECPAPFTALAASLTGREWDKRLNLLRDRIQDQAWGTHWRDHLHFAATALIALVLCWGTAFGTDIILQQQRLDTLRAQTARRFHEALPEAAESIQPLQYASILENRIQEQQSTASEGTRQQAAATELLHTVSTALPADLGVQITVFALDGDSGRMNGLAQDFKTVDRIKNALDQQSRLRNVTIIGANVDQGGDGVSFSLRFQSTAQG